MSDLHTVKLPTQIPKHIPKLELRVVNAHSLSADWLTSYDELDEPHTYTVVLQSISGETRRKRRTAQTGMPVSFMGFSTLSLYQFYIKNY